MEVWIHQHKIILNCCENCDGGYKKRRGSTYLKRVSETRIPWCERTVKSSKFITGRDVIICLQRTGSGKSMLYRCNIFPLTALIENQFIKTSWTWVWKLPLLVKCKMTILSRKEWWTESTALCIWVQNQWWHSCSGGSCFIHSCTSSAWRA